MTEQLPAVFGNYILLELIARGGMAEIYRAKMRSDIDGFERQVAIKKILSHLAENEEFITMLIDEARICVSLNHANIAQVYDLGRVGDTYYIAMEYIPGIDLSHVIKRLAQQGYLIPLEHAIFITKEMCAGLYFAHRKTDEHGRGLNIVHRDISPHNLLVSFNGDVKVIDFGVAKASVKLGQTRMGVIKGKLLYMAPEQAMAKPIDGRADIFSGGLCLYKMLTGRLPFEASNEFQIYNKVLTADITPPKAINPNIPEELNRIVMKSLDRDLNRRYQDCWAMHQDLEQVLHRYSPGYTSARLARFLEQHFVEEKAKLTKRLSSYPSMSAMETSQPSAPSGSFEGKEQGPNTPAGGHRSHPQPREPVPVGGAASYPNRPQTNSYPNSYPNGQPGSYPQGRQGTGVEVSYPQVGTGAPPVAMGGEPTQAMPLMSGAVPALPRGAIPSPESLGFRASQAHREGGDEPEADPTVDMRLDPALLQAKLREADQDADATQNMTLPSDLAEQAKAHMVAHRSRRPERATRSKLPLILVIVGVVFLVISLGVVGALIFGGFGEEARAPVTEPEVDAPGSAAEEAPKLDPKDAIKAATYGVGTALHNAGEETSAEVRVVLQSEPPGATVQQGRETLGQTPVTLKLPRGKGALKYQLKLDGYKPQVIDLVPDRSREQTVTLEEKAKRGGGAGNGGGNGGNGGLLEPW